MKKIKIDNLRVVKPITIEELEILHTGSLLTRLKQLRSLQDTFEVSDWLPEEYDVVKAAGLIAFKNTQAWKMAHSDVKTLLANREHLPRGSKEKRRQAAFLKANR